MGKEVQVNVHLKTLQSLRKLKKGKNVKNWATAVRSKQRLKQFLN